MEAEKRIELVGDNSNSIREGMNGKEANISSVDKEMARENIKEIIGCGYPRSDWDVEIVIAAAKTNIDSEQIPSKEIDGQQERGEGESKIGDNVATYVKLEELQIGEIWVASPSKAAGYFNLPIESEDFFGYLDNDGEINLEANENTGETKSDKKGGSKKNILPQDW